MTHEESEDMSFHVSKLECLVKGSVSKGYFDKSMDKLRKDLEKGMEVLVKTLDLSNLQIHIEEKMCHLEINIVEHMKNDIMESNVKLLPNSE